VSQAAPDPARRWEILCWVFTLLCLAYAAFIHYGIGPMPFTASPKWYQPRGFIETWEWTAWALEPKRRAIPVFTFPAVALAIAVFVSGRSALARALALSSAVAVVLFCFYGVIATRIWEFFHWRASAVLVLMSLAIGFTLAAPLLAASWLRLSWLLRALLYVPIVFLVVAFIRNATGTNVHLPFAISPWPAVPVFGIEVGALFVMVWMLGTAIGVACLARARSGGSRALVIAAGLILGIAVPCGLLLLGSALSMLPFRTGTGTLTTVAVACALGILLLGTIRAGSESLQRRALHLGVGTALVALPLLSGEAWARWDYYVTREHRAGELIDAMDRYYDDEAIYPDELEELVEADYLDALPDPSIGFGFLYEGSFRYRSFGTSYILEFPAPRWVECAYSPPYDDEEDEEEDEELEPWESADYAAGDSESMDGSWSCPEKPPELW